MGALWALALANADPTPTEIKERVEKLVKSGIRDFGGFSKDTICEAWETLRQLVEEL